MTTTAASGNLGLSSAQLTIAVVNRLGAGHPAVDVFAPGTRSHAASEVMVIRADVGDLVAISVRRLGLTASRLASSHSRKAAEVRWAREPRADPHPGDV